MNELMTLARALGERLAASDEYKNFCDTRDTCKANPLLKAKLDEFKVQKKVYDIESAKEEIDEKLLDAISGRMEALYAEITSHPEMKAYNKAEETLNILLNAINMTITSYITPENLTSENVNYDEEDCDDEGGENCTHNCSTCRGCH